MRLVVGFFRQTVSNMYNKSYYNSAQKMINNNKKTHKNNGKTAMYEMYIANVKCTCRMSQFLQYRTLRFLALLLIFTCMSVVCTSYMLMHSVLKQIYISIYIVHA